MPENAKSLPSVFQMKDSITALWKRAWSRGIRPSGTGRSRGMTPYYKQIIPFLKEHGVANVFMDTDGDFRIIIPAALEAGIEGFLPIDVNAGVDIVAVRQTYPKLKFFGGFNKLSIIDGPEAIEAELERLTPVIQQGGCIICTDHQAAPDTTLENYRYYVRRLKETVAQYRNENVKIG
ncbi:MAG: hypothetical protein IJ121_09830 [Eubacterium sp.]|nr:hypothetical protein [Eubacterium sp.]